ncbi:MAG: ABC transporter permease [Gemmatimonadaceae bacterium]
MPFIDDLRTTWRALAKRPTYTIAVSAVLAMLIASTTVVFIAVNAILIRPLPLPDADRLVALCEFRTKERDSFCVSTVPNAEDIRASSHAFADVGVARDWSLTLRTTTGGEGIVGGIATPGFFTTLRLSPALGRSFARDEVGPSARVAVVSAEFARQRFGSDAQAINRTITLDDQLFTIVGILGPNAYVPTLESVAVWVPLPFNPRDEENRAWRGFKVVARLADGASIETARSEMRTMAATLHRQYFASNADWDVELVTVKGLVIGSVERGMTMLLMAVALVVLIGCANLANLLLARTTQRRPELALRLALGASRGALARTVMAEGLLLSALGVGAGVPLAAWLTDALRTLAPIGLPRAAEVQFDLAAASFAVALGLVIAVLVGILPALLTRHFGTREALVDGGRGAIETRSSVTARTLVGVQLAIACVLLTGGVVLSRAFTTLSRWDPGFPLGREAAVWLAAPSGPYPTGQDALRVFDRVQDEIRALPGVEKVGAVSAGPLFGGTETGSAIPTGAPAQTHGTNVRWFDAGPGYFSTIGMALVRGRDFDARDVPGSPMVTVINERLAGMLWPNENPLGKRITLTVDSASTFEVVGVVRDVAPMNPAALSEPELYWSNRQRPRWGTYLVVRSASDPSALTKAIQERVRAVDPELQLGRISTLEQLARRELVVPRFATVLVAGFTVMALAIAAVGLFGLQAYAVTQRQREFGVRLALGASPGTVRWFVLRQGLRTGAVALIVGVPLAQIAARPLGAMLAGGSAHDPLTLLAVVLVLIAVTVLGSFIPARRAARLDPMEALRSE